MKYVVVNQVIPRRIPVGYWLVQFTCIWDMDEETGSEWIAEIESDIRQVTAADFGLHNMTTDTNTDDQHDDTHDLRDRLFETEAEAREHAEYTLNRFTHPQPWESFVKLG